jgi:beta-xylosidase
MVRVNGKGVATYQKPNVRKEYPIKILPTPDEFDSTMLGLQSGWNHNPDSTIWSLTQRIFAYYSRTIPTNAVIKMETDSIDDGDIPGLAMFQNPYAFIGVKQTNGQKYVIKVNNGKTVDSTLIYSSTIYLKAQANYGTSQVSFAYGLNDQSIKKLGNTLSMKFDLSIFTGNKFCLFNYDTIKTGGFVDFDWFRIGWNKLTGVENELRFCTNKKLLLLK